MPTTLRVPARIRRRIAAIPDLAWVRVRDWLCRGAPYCARGQPAKGTGFYIYYVYHDSEFTLQSSLLLVVRRNSGRVMYHGSANDEG